jgi:hypothetical protein
MRSTGLFASEQTFAENTLIFHLIVIQGASMNGIKIFAIILIVAGVLGLVYGGITFTKRTGRTVIGPIELSVNETQTIPVPLWAGVGAIAMGGGLLLIRKKIERCHKNFRAFGGFSAGILIPVTDAGSTAIHIFRPAGTTSLGVHKKRVDRGRHGFSRTWSSHRQARGYGTARNSCTVKGLGWNRLIKDALCGTWKFSYVRQRTVTCRMNEYLMV